MRHHQIVTYIFTLSTESYKIQFSTCDVYQNHHTGDLVEHTGLSYIRLIPQAMTHQIYFRPTVTHTPTFGPYLGQLNNNNAEI
jgi:hypothetical protein